MDDFVLIDLRDEDDYKKNHLNNAINISINEILNENKVNDYKNKTIYLYCRSGNRSNIAFNYLKKNNIESIDLGSIQNARKKLKNKI